MTGIVTTFCHHIVNVVLLCAKKEMIGICAGWIVAFVKHKKAIGNWAEMYFVRDTMGIIKNALKAKLAIAASATRIGPVPASIIGTLDTVCPKRFRKCFVEHPMASRESTGFAVVQPYILTAAALTFAVWLKQAMLCYPRWVFCFWSQVVMVVMQEYAWKAANLTQFGIGYGGNGRILTTTALAFAVGLQQAILSYPRSVFSYVARKVWSMIGVHKKSPFLCRAGGVISAARLFLLGYFHSILPHLNEYNNERIDNFEHFGKAWIRRRADLLKEASKP